MRYPEPCRIKHTEDNEEQTGWFYIFLSLLIVLMVIMFQVVLDFVC